MKPIAWYDPTNGMVSTDKDSHLFTPLGQVWPLYTQRTWTGLTDDEIGQLAATHLFQNVWPHSTFAAIHAIEAKLKEKNSGHT